MDKLIQRADVLVEALPYIRTFAGKTIVIKYGGNAMVQDALKYGFAEDVVLLKYVGLNPVVVHGGGPQINHMLARLGIQPTFQRGVRVTDQETMDVVQMVLGAINKEIVTLLNQHGGKAIGITGQDAGSVLCKPLSMKAWSRGLHPGTRGAARHAPSFDQGKDYGFVGEVDTINPHLVATLQQENFIPVIAPIGVDPRGRPHNINADLVAGAMASALKAEKLLMLTDVQGIHDASKCHLSTLSRKNVARMVKQGTIGEGMLPKVRACLRALDDGVPKAHIIDGRVAHAILLELFTDKGIGTEIVA